MLIHAEEAKNTKHRLVRLYAEYCKRFYEEFERGMDRDRLVTVEETREWSISDRILAFHEEEISTLEPA